MKMGMNDDRQAQIRLGQAYNLMIKERIAEKRQLDKDWMVKRTKFHYNMLKLCEQQILSGNSQQQLNLKEE